jgi:anionic cell wall polymer biosynthesis LytR-Cps2A-Psr (LCP) family protein
MSASRLSSFFTLRRTLTGAILLLGLALTATLGTLAIRAKLQLDAGLHTLQGKEALAFLRTLIFMPFRR